MEMMEEREALADARAAKDLTKVRAFGRQIQARNAVAEANLVRGFEVAFGAQRTGTLAIDEAGKAALLVALPMLGELRFYRRFLDEVSAIEEEEEEAP
jgi:molecular chaperone HscB